MRLQYALNLIPDGVFGKLTEEAVKNFQKKNGLKPDGIVGEKTWAKLPQLSATGVRQSKRVIKEIIVHCTATPEGRAETVESIRKMHKARGWSDIGYHYVVYLDGSVHNGRNVDIVGAHCEGHNANSIGVVYVGGVDKKGKAKDTRTDKQKKALVDLLKELKNLYPNAKIRGHRDYSPDKNHNGIIEPSEFIKDCPSFDAKNEYKNI